MQCEIIIFERFEYEKPGRNFVTHIRRFAATLQNCIYARGDNVNFSQDRVSAPRARLLLFRNARRLSFAALTPPPRAASKYSRNVFQGCARSVENSRY